MLPLKLKRMKRILTLGLLIGWLFSCTKDKFDIPIYLPGPMTFGQMTAVKGDKNWIGSGAAFRHEDRPNEFVGVGAGTFSEEGFERENILFNEIPINKIGEYTIRGDSLYDGFVGAHYTTLTDDGDVIEDRYTINEDLSDNWLIVTDIDTATNMIKGTFNVSFVLSTLGGKKNPHNPDKITFSDGAFEVQIIK